jgi:NitT/TauT family transport system substrate-binding protein
LAAPTVRASPRVRAGQLGALSDTGLLLGAARGFYSEQGLELHAARYNSPSQVLAALSSGQLEAASVPISAELLSVLARGPGLKLVAEAAGAPPGHGAGGLLVRPDLAGGLKTPTDLRGFRIGLPARGGSLEVELAALVKQGWLAHTDVEVVVLPISEVGPALADGSLEAAMLFEPDLSELAQRGLGRVWRRSDRILPNHLTAALVFTTRFGSTQPDAARRYVTAYLKALRLYNDVFVKGKAAERGGLIHILSRSTNVSEPAQFNRMVLPGMNPNGMVNVETLRIDQQFFLATGQQQREVDLAAVVDSQYAAYAIIQLGEYR